MKGLDTETRHGRVKHRLDMTGLNTGTRYLQALHWLPVQASIDYNLSTICHILFSDSSPACLSDHLTVYLTISLFIWPSHCVTLSRQLWSPVDTQILPIPWVRTKPFGQCTSSYRNCAPKWWSLLPSDIHNIQSSHAPKIALKIHLYK